MLDALKLFVILRQKVFLISQEDKKGDSNWLSDVSILFTIERLQMPTVLRIVAYRLFFIAGDKSELSHIHIERDDNLAKFGLDPVRL
ncbi:MAG: hypothetical protein WCI64_10615 [Chlorobium sp.]